jgi:hypothetical protein
MAKTGGKKRRRKRRDPDRAAAQAQREEARRRQAEERRRQAEAEDRRKRLRQTVRRIGIPVAGGLAVFVIALTLMRPDPEVDSVVAVNAGDLMTSLGYADFDRGIDDEALPPPRCGVLTATPSAEETYSLLRNGAVVLWHRPDDTATAATLAGFLEASVTDWPAHVAVAPAADAADLPDPILASAWGRLKPHHQAGEVLRDFVDTYRSKRGPLSGDCPIPSPASP